MSFPNKLLFLNVGWMERYLGPADDDPTVGDFRYLHDRKHGHECYNFADQGGWCFGHHPSSAGTNIDKLGAQPNDQSVDHIDVIWFSKDPNKGKAVIIGWYSDATVYRHFQTPQNAGACTLDGDTIAYKVKARFANCHPLPIDQRLFHVPSKADATGGYGQNANWYGGSDLFRQSVRGYLKNLQDTKRDFPQATVAPKNTDPDLRRKVERIAVEEARAYYESEEGGRRRVDSVETDNRGWDLEAHSPSDTLLVEVKGLVGSIPCIELTPNEYTQMRVRKDVWVLFIATECLSARPVRREIRYDYGAHRWKSLTGEIMRIEEKTGAIVSSLGLDKEPIH